MSQTSQKLKDYFTPVGVGVLTALLTVASPITGKLGNTFDGSALAQDIKPVKHAPTSIPAPQSDRSYSVKTKDFSDVPNRDARHVAGMSSPRAIVVLYQGSNKELMLQVLEGASEAKDGAHGHDPVYVRGMIIGKADPDFKGGTDSYVLYVDGLPVTNPADAHINPKQTVKELIFWADKEILKTRLLSFNHPTAEQ